ncbi:MAG: hypothetical protein D4R67_07835 [Bacteroidetes bacterium]|nr:MAG: hypothetical protein D4R67_07835 [Bacteroidota bacterium]
MVRKFKICVFQKYRFSANKQIDDLPIHPAEGLQNSENLPVSENSYYCLLIDKQTTMKKYLSTFLLAIFGLTALLAQEEAKKPLFGIKFSGLVKTDIFFDSRQTIAAREGHFLLYPDNEKLDADGKDINAKWNSNILSIQTRLAGSVWGPDALGAKTSAYIEGEFFGNINPAINVFRLRHAFIRLNWKTTDLLAGQTWHPMFVTDCSPATVSFNTGAPFVVFSRNPQIRIAQNINNIKVQLTALEQIDFTSDGPDGPSPKYLRNSVLPELNFLVQYGKSWADQESEFLIGASVNYQMLTPRLSTTVILSAAYDTVVNGIVQHVNEVSEIYQTDSKSTAFAASFFSKLKLKPVTIKLGAEWGQNNNAYTMLGGFAVRSITDTAKGFVDYANVQSIALWAEVHTNGTKWRPGLFGAFSKNLGIGETVIGPYYARGANIDYLWRVSPRLEFNVQRLRFAGEVEYTVAGYGKTTSKGFVSAPKAIGNLRLLLAVFYFF